MLRDIGGIETENEKFLKLFKVLNLNDNDINLLLVNPEIANIFSKVYGDFSYSMHELAHELGNIVTLINSSLQIIESSHPEVQSFKYWKSTQEDIQYLICLISQLSQFNNGGKLHIEQANFYMIISDIISAFSNDERYKNITFNFNAPENIPNINADSVKIKQVLINIIKNACEAILQIISTCEDVSADSEKKYIVDTSIRIIDESLVIAICDNGVGISPENISQIFKPMVTFKTNGTGLGLAISKKIIEAHNGSVMVASKLGEGTTFTITLPL